MNSKTQTVTTALTPRQNAYIRAYSDPASVSFGNSYQSALNAGYSDQTARNLTHLRPTWLSEKLGELATIRPDEIMTVLTGIIHDESEPTVVRLKAIEMTMRAYNMLAQRREEKPQAVQLSVDLSGASDDKA